MSRASEISNVTKQFGNKSMMQSILWIGLTLLILVFGTKIYKKIMKLIDDPFNEGQTQAEADKITKQVNAIVKVDYTRLPQNKAFYQQIADQQYKAMQGWATDWKTCVDSLKKLSAKELEAVYKEFGGRVNEDFGNEAMDLFGWYQDEYSMFSLPCKMYWPSLVAIWNRTNLNNRPS